MNVYSLKHHEDFDKWFEHHKHDGSELMRIEHEIEHIRQEPHLGKPLGLLGLHEKKFNGKRIIYVCFDEEKTIVLLDVCDKKHQEQDIQKYKEHLKDVREEISPN